MAKPVAMAYSDIELEVLTAIENEFAGLSKEERNNGDAEIKAWEKAYIYADMYGRSLAEFQEAFRTIFPFNNTFKSN